jgi:hypothetical protein
VLSGAVCDFSVGGGGEALFLAGFACAAEDAGDDLDAAETVEKLVQVSQV